MLGIRTSIRPFSSGRSSEKADRKKRISALFLAFSFIVVSLLALTSHSASAASFKINAGGSASGAWSADSKYSGGTAAKSTAAVNTSKVTNPAPATVYQTERWGNFTYTFSGLPANTNHTIRLHFNEFYYANVGQRIFSVQSNGTNILTDFDIIQASGGKNIAIAKDFTLKSNASGVIALKFTNAKADDPKVSGIELVTVTTPPATDNTPTSLAAGTTTTNSVALTWAAPSNPSGTVQGYNVYQGATKVNAALVAGTTYTVTGLSPSTAYSFSVKSVVGGVESGASNSVAVTTATPIPVSDIPTNVVSSAVSATGATLSWTAPSNPSGTVQGYNVYQGSTRLTATPVATTTYAVTGLAPATAYSFSVKSIVTGTESAASTVVSVTTPAAPPVGTTLLSRINAGGSSTGDWVADAKYTGGSADISTAAVNTTKVTNPAPQAVYQSERWGDFTYTFTGLQPDTYHTVRLHFAEFYWSSVGQRVFDVAANGTNLLTNYDIVKEAGGANIAVARDFTVKSDAAGTLRLVFTTKTDAAKVSGIELLTSTTPPVADNTPTNLVAGATTTNSIAVSWAAPSNPSGTVQGYNVYQGSTKVNTALITATTYIATGLTPSTTYSFSVKSVVGGVESGASNTLTVSTTSTTGFDGGIVTIDFDDGRMSVFNTALPIMNRYGFKSTQYLVSSAVRDQWPNYMTASHAKQMLDQGHEIGSHSVNHPYLTTLDTATLDSELQDSQATLRSLIGPSVAENFASPYGDYNASVVDRIRLYYGTHRSVETGLNVKGNFDRYNIRVVNVGSATSLNEIKSWVDQAKTTKSWLVLLYHGVDTVAADDYSVSTASFEAHMSYVASTGISVQTTKQALISLGQ